MIQRVTIRDRIRDVARRWKAQYSGADRVLPLGGKSTDEIFRALHALDPETATAADVEAIIGNRSWTLICCDVCCDEVPTAVEFWPPSDELCLTVCGGCLARALNS